MATFKTRINLSISSDINTALTRLAERDEVPEATKASQLLQLAIEIEEDDVLNSLAKQRDTKKVKFLSHKKVWA